jgi:hypothetical protein
MGMRVGGAGSSAAMAAWQTQQKSAAATPANASPAAASTPQATQANAQQQVASALKALASGSSFSKLA